jgi:hypothetical protein
MNDLQLVEEPVNMERQPGMERRVHLVSEETGRLSGRGNRLSFLLTYAFIALAMCLLLIDMFHLSAQPRDPEPQDNFSTHVSSGHHNASRAR